MDMRRDALAALACVDTQQKCALAHDLHQRALEGLDADLHAIIQAPIGADLPGRPTQPPLVHPSQVPTRSPHTTEGHAALIHAICHIEFNAINLALDAVWRFPRMPSTYYTDWIKVAAEEAKHFGLLQKQLRSLGFDYGDFTAHDGLWLMCEKTAHDVIARMALVPRTLEARGLDATPLIQKRLRSVGSPDAIASCAILDIILADEVGHVAIGNHWFHFLCKRAQLDPLAHYRALVLQHAAPRLKPPFNVVAREQAGFSAAEIAFLMADFGQSRPTQA